MVDRSDLARELAALTGLDVAVALNWLNAEGSIHPTNPLGILCGNSLGSGLEIGCEGRFARYRSVGDGLRAAAWLLAHGSHYGGVREAIESGTPVEQRTAIVTSGWAGGGYRKGAGFSTVGISGIAGPTGTPTGILASSPGSGAAGTTTTLDKLLGLPASTPIDAGTIKSIDQRVKDLETKGTISHAVAQGLLQQIGAYGVGAAHGMRSTLLGEVTVDLLTGYVPQPDVFGALFGWVPGTLVNGAVLVLILGLGYVGIRRVAG